MRKGSILDLFSLLLEKIEPTSANSLPQDPKSLLVWGTGQPLDSAGK